MRTNSIFNTQHVATGWQNARKMLLPTMLRYVVLKYWDRLAGTCKCWANNVAICCVDMLSSFGRGFRVYNCNRYRAFSREVKAATVGVSLVGNMSCFLLQYIHYCLGTTNVAVVKKLYSSLGKKLENAKENEEVK